MCARHGCLRDRTQRHHAGREVEDGDDGQPIYGEGGGEAWRGCEAGSIAEPAIR